jgi:hypothetical protein
MRALIPEFEERAMNSVAVSLRDAHFGCEFFAGVVDAKTTADK